MRSSFQVVFAVAVAAATSIPALALTSPRHSSSSEAATEPMPSMSPLKLELKPDVLSLHGKREGESTQLTLRETARPLGVDPPRLELSTAMPAVTGSTIHLRRLTSREVSAALVTEAQRLIQKHHDSPIGTEFPVEVSNRRYVARLEVHYHPVGGDLKPWGNHPGISLFAVDDARTR